MKFNVKDTMIQCSDPSLTVGDNKYTVSFEFDSTWDELTKTARFVQNGITYDVVLVDDTCEIDFLKKGVLIVGVFGTDKTTIKAKLKITESVLNNELVADPLPSVYEQIIELLNEVDPQMDRAEKAAEKAEAAEASAEASATTATTKAEAAEASATNAKTSETNASAYEASAQGYSATASSKANEASASATEAKASEDNAKASETTATEKAKEATDAVTGFDTRVTEATTTAVNTIATKQTEAVEAVDEAKDADVKIVNDLIATIPEDYTELTEEVSDIKNDLQLKADKTSLAKTDRQVSALFKITEGQSWEDETVTGENYSVDVPSGSVLAKIKMIGGKSVVWNQILKKDDLTQKDYGVTVTVNNGLFSVSGTSTANGALVVTLMTFEANHIYMVEISSNSFTYNLGFEVSTKTHTGNLIFASPVTGNYYFQKRIEKEVEYSDSDVSINVFDMTQMFRVTTTDAVTDEMKAFCETYAELHPEYNTGEIISSQNDMVVTVGKNLWDGIAYKGAINTNVPFIINETQLTSPYINPTNYQGVAFIAELKAGKTYALSTDLSGAEDRIFWGLYKSITDAHSYSNVIKTGTGNAPSFTTDDDCVLVFFKYGSTNQTMTWSYAQAEVGSTATSYSPYTKSEITTGFPVLRSAGDAYDYVDVENGKLHRCVGSVDMGELASSLGKSSDTTDEHLVLILANRLFTGIKMVYAYMLSNKLNSSRSVAKTTDYAIWNDASYVRFVLPVSVAADLDSAKSWLTENNPTLCYELAEEVVTDIDIPDDLEWLTVEGGGTITFHETDDGKRLLIPNTVTYTEILSEVNG